MASEDPRRIPIEEQPWFIRSVLDPTFEHPFPTWFEGGDSVAPFTQSPGGEIATLMGELRTKSQSGPWSSTVCCDLGCGNASLLVAMAKAFRCRVVGVDIEPELIALAREHAEDEGVLELVTAFQGNLREPEMWAHLLLTMGMPADAIAIVLADVAGAASDAATPSDEGSESLGDASLPTSPMAADDAFTAREVLKPRPAAAAAAAAAAAVAAAPPVTDLVFFNYLLPEALEIVQPWLAAILALNDRIVPGARGAIRTHVVVIEWQFQGWVPSWWMSIEQGGGYGGYGKMTVYSGPVVPGHMVADGARWVADGAVAAEERPS